MSENTAEVIETVEPNETVVVSSPPSPESPRALTPEELQEKYEDLYALGLTLKTVADSANADALKRKSLLSSNAEKVDNVLNTSDDADLKAYREFAATQSAKIEKAKAQIAAAEADLAEKTSAAKEKAKSLIPNASDDDAKNLQTAYLKKRTKVTALTTTVLTMVEDDEDKLNEFLSDFGIVSVISSASGKTSSNAGEIVRKKISSASYNGKAVEKDGKTSFTLLSKASQIDGQEIRDAFLKAYNESATEKQDDLRNVPEGATATFTIVNGDKTHVFSVTV